MELTERQKRILYLMVKAHIVSGEPVSSKYLSQALNNEVSSATVRNEMSVLAEQGYLDQPHVSAGRIPSAKAYRLYVDQLLQNGSIRTGDAADVRAYFTNRAQQMEDVISRAAQVLSGLTHYTSLVMSPKGAELRIRTLQLVPVSSQSALLVIVTDGGIMRDSVIRVGSEMDSDALYAVSRTLTERLSGHTLSEALTLIKETERDMQAERQVLSGVAEFLDAVDSEGGKAKLTLGGASNILNFPEYSDVEKARCFLSVLETKDKLLKLMENHGEMAFTVRIGPETGIPELEDCSLVTATYRLSDNTHGTIGVIGPTRMQYGRVLSVLSAMGKQLTDLLRQDKE